MREVICQGIFIIPRKSLKDLDGTGLYHLERAGFNVKKTEVNWQEETNSLTGKRTIIVTERTTIVIAKTIFRDALSGLQDLYMSAVSNRMNEIMKVLTIMASIFIPLTFVAGIYGMNFEYMPELKWHWSYFTVWGFMIFSVICMLFYFRSKKWL